MILFLFLFNNVSAIIHNIFFKIKFITNVVVQANLQIYLTVKRVCYNIALESKEGGKQKLEIKF